ncbi:FtsW/RodA/SpoVE family cell cycle protein [Hirschia baltica]|uniref:Probable peptidoglycan glycosyltransferase FtsW n=1 Tax=Hirschia baltica (strain ATCC 49814 / DSM 5838 / IFAM 1418) TaxID=582402 RepID=C6XMF1_HIRBI|nr:putative peptidoglycan glycosyltransferase FtsW [Hirschia baltica]ACT58094.1 cell cycle protein [Hirschia baltica ATCC 49814]
MTSFARSDRSLLAEWWRTVDKLMLASLFLLMGVGLLVSLAAGPAASERIGFSDPYHFVYRQAFFMACAAILLVGTSILTPPWARRVAGIVFFLGFLLMAYILLFGHEAKGAQRWIRIAGTTFQPSEIVKPALVLIIGWLLAQREHFPNAPWTLVAFILYAATMGLLLLQPDVGQSALLTAGFLAAFFVSGISLSWVFGLGAGFVALGGSLFTFFPHVRHRVNSFINPSEYDTYQIDTAREAIERGGLMGAGMGEGQIKHDLPDAHTDFIYSVIGEEFGLFVCVALIILFAVITVRGVLTASRHPDPYPRAAAVGLFTLFGIQAAINISVNIALIPNKGMTLPFISSGGSSLLGSALTLGFALALTRRRPEISMRRFIP